MVHFTDQLPSGIPLTGNSKVIPRSTAPGYFRGLGAGGLPENPTPLDKRAVRSGDYICIASDCGGNAGMEVFQVV